jgi:hypothetical protein
VKEGGRLALDFDGSNDTLSTTYQPQLGTASTADLFTFAVSSQASSHRGTIWRASDSDRVVFIRWDSSNFQSSYRDSDRVIVSGVSSALSLNNQYLLTGSLINGAVTNYVDGTINGTGSVSFTGDFNLSSPFYVGSRGGTGERLNGNLQELIFYTSDKSSVRTDIEGNISAYFQSAKLLDEQFGEDAEAAYSTRQLRRDQTDCMVIRRASDSTTTTIGFDANGDIDETAIETFCTGTTCTVVTWKDQSGNGNDATASDPAYEPTIYTGGEIVKRQGKVAILGADSNDVLNFTQIDFSGDLFFTSIYEIYNLQKITSGANNNFLGMFFNSYSSTRSRFDDGTNSGLINASVGGLSQNQKVMYSLSRSGTALNNIEVNVNGINRGVTTTNVSTNSSQIGPILGAYQEVIFYDSAKNASDRASVEENQGDYFTQNTPLLDTYSGAAAAYSLRKLNSSYTGPAIEVYAGTNGTADIGFNVFGELDTVALAAHCGNQNGTVRTWYDQSGNGNHATQGVAGNQPKIYDGATTSVVTDGNGKPEMLCTSDWFALNSSITLSSGYSCIHVSEQSARNAPSFGASVNYHYITLYQNSNVWFYHTNAGRTIPYVVPLDTKQLHWLNWSGTNVGIGVDGAALQTGALSTSTQIDWLMRASGASPTWQGRMQEMIIYDSDKETAGNRAGIEDNINTFYSIY